MDNTKDTCCRSGNMGHEGDCDNSRDKTIAKQNPRPLDCFDSASGVVISDLAKVLFERYGQKRDCYPDVREYWEREAEAVAYYCELHDEIERLRGIERRAKNCVEILSPSHLRWLLTGENNA